jgi:hypothetical protein
VRRIDFREVSAQTLVVVGELDQPDMMDVGSTWPRSSQMRAWSRCPEWRISRRWKPRTSSSGS